MALGREMKLAWRALLTIVFALAVTGERARAEQTTSTGKSRVKVALVLSISAEGALGKAARSIKQGAEMAFAEWQDSDLHLMIEDDGGKSDDTDRAIRRALDAGAQMILGPQLPESIRNAAKLAGPRGVPMIVFSNDPIVAAPGVYWLANRPNLEVERIVDYSVSRGKRVFGALLSDTRVSTEAALRAAIERRGGTLAAIEHYPIGTEPPRDIAEKFAIDSIEAIFLSDATGSAWKAARSLKSAGVDLQRIQLIGTGNWFAAGTFAEPTLQGGWFASPDLDTFGFFADRYRKRFGEAVDAYALMAYDAVSLAVAASKTKGFRSFTADVLSNASGFKGTIGPFRFRSDRTTERLFGVYRVAPSGADLLSPVPESFSSE